MTWLSTAAWTGKTIESFDSFSVQFEKNANKCTGLCQTSKVWFFLEALPQQLKNKVAVPDGSATEWSDLDKLMKYTKATLTANKYLLQSLASKPPQGGNGGKQPNNPRDGKRRRFHPYEKTSGGGGGPSGSRQNPKPPKGNGDKPARSFAELMSKVLGRDAKHNTLTTAMVEERVANKQCINCLSKDHVVNKCPELSGESLRMLCTIGHTVPSTDESLSHPCSQDGRACEEGNSQEVGASLPSELPPTETPTECPDLSLGNGSHVTTSHNPMPACKSAGARRKHKGNRPAKSSLPLSTPVTRLRAKLAKKAEAETSAEQTPAVDMDVEGVTDELVKPTDPHLSFNTRVYTVRPKGKEDYAVRAYVFADLQEKSGMQLTLDCCANEGGDNALLPKHLSTSNCFFDNNLSGELCWINPPFDHATKFVEHYTSNARGTTPLSAHLSCYLDGNTPSGSSIPKLLTWSFSTPSPAGLSCSRNPTGKVVERLLVQPDGWLMCTWTGLE